MARLSISDDLLNAYVDGELPADNAAILADMVAADAALARRVAALADLKAGVASFALPEPPALPQVPVPSRRFARLSGGGLIAAGLAVAVLVGWVFVPPPGTPPGTSGQHATSAPTMPAAVLDLHDSWVAQGRAVVPDADLPEAPDWMRALLEANGLQLRHVAGIALPPEGTGKHYAFVGPNKCKLSLFEAAAAPGGAFGMQLSADGELQTATWQSGAHAYAMVARNMNQVRFATIAASVHSATQTRSLGQGELLAAMAGARQRCTV